MVPIDKPSLPPLLSAKIESHAYVFKYFGFLLALLACSQEYAIFIKVGSENARPKKDIPIGILFKNPEGTVIFG